MKVLKKILKIFLILLAGIIVAGALFINRLKQSGLPNYDENVELSGLMQTVTVYRDSLAIPHIYAQSDKDLYRAVGYLMAQDRMWQMDLLRRVTLGRLSEIFGDDFVQTDLLLRSLRFSDKSEKILKTTDPLVVEAFQSFSEGINAYINDYDDNFPIEFKILGYKPDLWEPEHSVNLIGYMAWDLKSGWSEYILNEIASKVDSTQFMELLPTQANQKHVVYSQQDELLCHNALLQLESLESLGLDIFSGSNNWAVSGEKSVTGKPLLSNDMHISFGIPGIWMQMHQIVEGKLNVSGLVLPGQPFVIVGHNDSIAWGMTNTYVDNLDIYQEKIHPDDSNKYLYNGEWLEFEVRNELIKTKGGDEHYLKYRINHRGPVISSYKKARNKVLTMHWVGDEESDEVWSVYQLNRAGNITEFRDAFRTFRSIGQNVVYADVQGNIGLQCCAGVPIRKRDAVYGVLPGWTDEYDWQGMIPFDELPCEYNPERGYVSSANNRTVDSTYPYHIGTWYDIGYRIDRIRELLQEKSEYSVEDFKRIQNDKRSNYSELFLKKLLPLIQPDENWGRVEQEAYSLLSTWDYTLHTGSVEAAIAELWNFNLLAQVFGDEMGDELFSNYIKTSRLFRHAMHELLTGEELGWVNDVRTNHIENIADIAMLTFEETVIELRNWFGDDIHNWEWGAMHQFTLEHPLAKVEILDKVFKLNRGAYPVGGSYHTVAPYKYMLFDPDKIVHGASHRSIVSVGNWDNNESVIPTGTSGIPSSGFYCDQTEFFVKGKYYPEYYCKDVVEENSLFQMQFKPTF